MFAAIRRGIALVRGDLLERVRRPAFFVTLGFMIWATWVFLPSREAIYRTVDIDGHRVLYDSAGIGGLLAVLANAFLTFAGFYVVRGSVERDRHSGVGALVAATPLSTLGYLYSKVGSNFAVLATMLAMVGVAGAAMQFVLGEDRALDLPALFAPIVTICGPAMLLVAALAVAFDCVPGLRGGLGNLVFFVIWMLALAAPVEQMNRGAPDAFGMKLVTTSMVAEAQRQYPRANLSAERMSVGINIPAPRDRGRPVERFRWPGIAWTPAAAAGRLGWVGFSLALVAMASIPFDRFAGTGSEPRRTRSRRRDAARDDDRGPDVPGPAPARPALRVAALAAPVAGSSLAPLIRAEWTLLTRGATPAWKVVALGLAVAGAFAPLHVSRSFIAVAAWIWPIFRWSELGVREHRFDTHALMRSVPHPVARPLLAAWIAGAALALAMVGGVALRLVLAGDGNGLLATLVGAAFVPAFALAAGTWTGGTKLFEVLYLLLWYIGPLNRVPWLDYSGAHPGAWAAGAPLGFGVAAMLLAAAAAWGRRRE